MAANGVFGRVRYDYAKFLVECEPDRIKTWIEPWEAHVQYAQSQLDFDGGAKWRQVRGSHGGEALYSFEAWGELSNMVMDMDWNLWYPRLERMDVREDATVTERGLDELYDHLNALGSEGRNVQRFNSRIKSKSQGRGTGGVGIAIGSHKSDFRATIYKRGREQGAMEYQLQGRRIEDAVRHVEYERDNEGQEAKVDPWLRLRSKLWMAANMELTKVSKLRMEDLYQAAAGNRSLTAAVENRLERIEGMIEQLDRNGKIALMEVLQMSIQMD